MYYGRSLKSIYIHACSAPRARYRGYLCAHGKQAQATSKSSGVVKKSLCLPAHARAYSRQWQTERSCTRTSLAQRATLFLSARVLQPNGSGSWTCDTLPLQGSRHVPLTCREAFADERGQEARHDARQDCRQRWGRSCHGLAHAGSHRSREALARSGRRSQRAVLHGSTAAKHSSTVSAASASACVH